MADARLHVMQRRVAAQPLVLRRVSRVADLEGPGPADRELVESHQCRPRRDSANSRRPHRPKFLSSATSRLAGSPKWRMAASLAIATRAVMVEDPPNARRRSLAHFGCSYSIALAEQAKALPVTIQIMKDGVRRLWSVIAVVVIVAAVLAVLYDVWRSKNRADAATYGAFAVPVVALALGWIAWVWRTGTKKADSGAQGAKLNDRADLLAEAVLRQWTQAADERGLLTPEPIPVRWRRPVLPLAGPAEASVRSRRFEPLPGVPSVADSDLTEGQIDGLHSIYGGLGSGRMVIAGAPGSGKSGTAALLALAALRYREGVADGERPRVPVPLCFTAHDWDPVSQRIEDWLTERMRLTYSLFDGRAGAADAAALVGVGKVSLILDGLDEMAGKLRPIALRALSRQGAFRAVVLSRTAEMASAASTDGLLQGAAAIELQAVDPDTAADYLSRVHLDPPPDGWRDLINRIRSPNSQVARALDNPLNLALVRDTYRAGDDVRELLEFCDSLQQQSSVGCISEGISDHLLDRVLPAAYAVRPGEAPPAYDLQTAQRAFRHIAARMSRDRTRDLQWWHISEWMPARSRMVVTGFVMGLFGWAGFGLEAGLQFGLVEGLVGGLAAGCGFGFFFGRIWGRGGEALRLTTRMRLAVLKQTNVRNFVSGFFAFGLAMGVAVGVARGIWSGLLFGLLAALFGGSGLGLDTAMSAPDRISSTSPLGSWRSARKHAFVSALAVGVTGAVVIGAGFGLAFGARFGLIAGIAGVSPCLGVGLVSSGTWPSSLAFAQLTLHWHTPMRLMRFLDDARERGVLRTVGPVYQFRHARLQDRLAGQAIRLRFNRSRRMGMRDAGDSSGADSVTEPGRS